MEQRLDKSERSKSISDSRTSLWLWLSLTAVPVFIPLRMVNGNTVTCFIRYENSQQHTDPCMKLNMPVTIPDFIHQPLWLYIYVYNLQKYKSLWDIVNTYLCRQHSLYCIRK